MNTIIIQSFNIKVWKLLELQNTQTSNPKNVADRLTGIRTEWVDPLLDLLSGNTHTRIEAWHYVQEEDTAYTTSDQNPTYPNSILLQSTTPIILQVNDFISGLCSRKIIFLFLNQNICCGYSKEPSQRDVFFEHPKHMLNLWVRKYLQFYNENFCLSKPICILTQTFDISLIHHCSVKAAPR